ncbi:MAG: galactokinase [Paenibacillaceae bacterium]|nr:galactokinase [Paenibacillaceae bacterium]
MADIQQLTQQFKEIYGDSPEKIESFLAPGRVNLIGEHTDYNGGYVFPAALTFGTTLLIRKRGDRGLGLASTNMELRKSMSLDDLAYRGEDQWMNYPKGVIVTLRESGVELSSGYDMLFHGEIPHASGLSSSASVEVVTAYALLSMEGKPLDTVQIALLSQKAENKYVGVNCGIMDQFAVANGKQDHAIMLMCDTLAYELVPFRSGKYQLVIGNTKKKRGLAESAYNQRRAECEQAVQDLQSAIPGLTLLGQITPQQLSEHEHLIQDATVRRRAKHVVEEIDRVVRAVDVLKKDDLVTFGRLMNESHESLRDLYEVSCKELDVMVEAARAIPGVLGSRMTGAGFGGCTVSLVHEDSIARFNEEVGRKYTEGTGLVAEFYTCSIGDGVKRVEGE